MPAAIINDTSEFLNLNLLRTHTRVSCSPGPVRRFSSLSLDGSVPHSLHVRPLYAASSTRPALFTYVLLTCVVYKYLKLRGSMQRELSCEHL